MCGIYAASPVASSALYDNAANTVRTAALRSTSLLTEEIQRTEDDELEAMGEEKTIEIGFKAGV